MMNLVRPLPLAVPAYFHPAADPQAWERLAELVPALRLVVVNVHNGPGDVLDPSYASVVRSLRAAGAPMVGYVDTDYGRRPVRDVAADVRAYVQRYQLTGVFLDQASARLADLGHYARCVAAVRAAGACFVVLNPGTHPHPAYVDLTDVTVTFEGTWAQYRSLSVPPWVYRRKASLFCHLVHTVPADAFGAVLDLAVGRHAGSVYVTDGAGANPWNHLPAPLLAAVDAGGTRVSVRREAP